MFIRVFKWCILIGKGTTFLKAKLKCNFELFKLYVDK